VFFSGINGNYHEGSNKDGTSVYAQTKSLGEIDNSKDLTLRTSIIGPELNLNGIGLFNWFFQQEGVISGYTNSFWTGITTFELMNAIDCAIKNNLTGLYHLVNSQKISKHELLELIKAIFNRKIIILPNDKHVVDKSLINTRKDFVFKVKSYSQMIEEMRQWIDLNIDLYPHYRNLVT